VKFRNEKNRERTDEEKALRVKGLLEKEKEKRTRLKELGIDYEVSGYVRIITYFQEALTLSKYSKGLLTESRRHCMSKQRRK